jgi:NAD(P)-dependent dehydrogenase (short-subunit alcohol dehydrogenase family)
MAVVLVSGCSTGIGRAAAWELARRGDRVFAGARRPADVTELTDEARVNGLAVEGLRLDVNDPASIDDAIRHVEARAGHADALVNNAGISMLAALEEVSDEDAHLIMETNLFGPFRLIRRVLPAMRSHRSGTIVNVSSLAGIAPRPYKSIYTASKHALDGMSFSLAAEVAEFGIRVVVVSPGRFKSAAATQRRGPTLDVGEPRYRAVCRRSGERERGAPATADPNEVARCIANCIHSDHVPARVVVGEDGRALAERRRSSTDDEYLATIVDEVAHLS